MAVTLPALAEYLGPDRTTVEEVVVRDPDHDVWTLTHVDPFDGYSDVCLVLHTCEEHPSVERQAALCGWVADNSGCEEAYKTELRPTTLPEATVSADLSNCSPHLGWCSAAARLHLAAAEPLAGYEITGIEGTRSGEAFFCAADRCDLPLLEGENDLTFWALSSYGDSSLMGSISARVDTTPPATVLLQPEEGTSVAVAGEIALRGVSTDAASGLASVELSRDGGANWIDLPFASDGTWTHRWDTRLEAEGARLVLARAWDNAGHSGSQAQVAVQVDRTAPRVRLPDSWPIWEQPRLNVSDSGSGVSLVVVTIDGDRYGTRRWEYRSPEARLPQTIVWDRRFGEVIAPIGEYRVTLEAWDRAGNHSADEGMLLIPDPGAPLAPAGPILDEEAALPADEGFAAGPAILPQVSAPVDGRAEPLDKKEVLRAAIQEEVVPLWGPAALAAAALVTAEVLRRRRERASAERIRLEALRHRAASAASPRIIASRLARLRERAERAIA
ncbi:MAG: Ig-like domain-containing protein, partial [Anaerolineales bacterium]